MRCWQGPYNAPDDPGDGTRSDLRETSLLVLLGFSEIIGNSHCIVVEASKEYGTRWLSLIVDAVSKCCSLMNGGYGREVLVEKVEGDDGAKVGVVAFSLEDKLIGGDVALVASDITLDRRRAELTEYSSFVDVDEWLDDSRLEKSAFPVLETLDIIRGSKIMTRLYPGNLENPQADLMMPVLSRHEKSPSGKWVF